MRKVRGGITVAPSQIRGWVGHVECHGHDLKSLQRKVKVDAPKTLTFLDTFIRQKV